MHCFEKSSLTNSTHHRFYPSTIYIGCYCWQGNTSNPSTWKYSLQRYLVLIQAAVVPVQSVVMNLVISRLISIGLHGSSTYALNVLFFQLIHQQCTSLLATGLHLSYEDNQKQGTRNAQSWRMKQLYRLLKSLMHWENLWCQFFLLFYNFDSTQLERGEKGGGCPTIFL